MAPTLFYDNGLHEVVRRGLTIATTLVRVQSRGHIRLRSADPTWHPEIEPGYFDDGSDLDAMVAGYRRMFEVAGEGPLKRFIDAPWEPPVANPTDEDIIASIGRMGQTLYHPVATCAMGTIEGSVVGPDLRVHGVENLRVADASVMPAVPRGNTNAPTIMVGEKAADLIKEFR
jgi:choline dehydrogenase-like flavoprotein